MWAEAEVPVFVFESFILFLCLCLSRGKEVAARHPALARVKDGVGVRRGSSAGSPRVPRVLWPRCPHARRSREISTAGGGSPKPAGWFPGCRSPRRRSREITPPDRR